MTDEDEPRQDGQNGSRPADEGDPLKALQAELERVKSDYLYLRAEFENYRKQAIKERSDLMKYGSERVLYELLNILDNFERALETAAKTNDLESYRKGVELTGNELRAVLNRFGVQEIPSHGEPFNPSIHEALGSEETDDHPPGHITNVYKKAYKLHDRVIRPGQVLVAKEKPKS